MEPEKTNYAKPVTIGVIIIVIIGLFIWGFFVKSPKEVLAPVKDSLATTTVDSYIAPTINIKHQYKGGVHTYGGLVDLPNPCTSLSTKIAINTAATPMVNIDLVSKDSGGICIQVIAPTYFKVSVTGPSAVTLRGTLNGKTVKFNVFEIPASENFDQTDIYLKG